MIVTFPPKVSHFDISPHITLRSQKKKIIYTVDFVINGNVLFETYELFNLYHQGT